MQNVKRNAKLFNNPSFDYSSKVHLNTFRKLIYSDLFNQNNENEMGNKI